MDVVEDIQEATTNNESHLAVVLAGLGGVIAGAVVGYLVGKHYGKVTIIQPETKKEVETPVVNNTFVIDADAFAQLDVGHGVYSEEFEPEAIHEVLLQPKEDTTPVFVNIFTNNSDDWDYEAQLATRNPAVPYIIHAEEYINDEMGFSQETVTYYAGDDIVASDQTETPIYNHHQVMGELTFGFGSMDPSIVYIRNERIKKEWEVLLHEGHFATEVLGLRMEEEDERSLRHSVPRMRRD